MPSVLTAEQAAEFLQLSVASVKAKARAGVIPAAKVGREWRFSRRRLLEWIEDGGTLSEDLVDEGIIRVVQQRRAATREGDLIPWDEAKAALR